MPFRMSSARSGLMSVHVRTMSEAFFEYSLAEMLPLYDFAAKSVGKYVTSMSCPSGNSSKFGPYVNLNFPTGVSAEFPMATVIFLSISSRSV